jgi:DNA-binding MarR family transcriptional regulator
MARSTSVDIPIRETQDGLKHFNPTREAAWIGLLRAHAEVTRGLDNLLAQRHGLTLSSYEILARLARAPDGHLRMSQLAEQCQLSLSRVSRLVDHLAERGLAARVSCATDSRVVHATATEEGRELARAAQDTFFETVEERFLGRLSCDEVDTLGQLFARMLEPDASSG